MGAGMIAGCAVLYAGLAGVGGAVVEDFGTVATARRARVDWLRWLALCKELRLRLQTAAALPKMSAACREQ